MSSAAKGAVDAVGAGAVDLVVDAGDAVSGISRKLGGIVSRVNSKGKKTGSKTRDGQNAAKESEDFIIDFRNTLREREAAKARSFPRALVSSVTNTASTVKNRQPEEWENHVPWLIVIGVLFAVNGVLIIFLRISSELMG